jgi:beta-glucosidase
MTYEEDTVMMRARWLRGWMFGVAIGLCCAATWAVAQQPQAKEAPAKKRSAACLPVPRTDAWWTKRQEQLNARVREAQGHVDLIFIGDSITQGWEGGGQAIWKEFYGKRNAVNLGIGGDQTQHVLWRLDHGNIQGISPKLAVIMIGTNNSHSFPPEEIAAGIRAIVKKLRKSLPETKVLVLAIFPRGPNNADHLRQVVARTNALLCKIDNGNTVRYLDIGPKFLGKDGTLSKEIMPDLLHLSPKGYRIWAEAIEPVVAEVVGCK